MLFSVCTCCNEAKFLYEFRYRIKRGRGNYSSWCKSCESKKEVIRNRERMKNNPALKEASLKRVTEWGKNNKQKMRDANNKHRRDSYKNSEECRSKKLSASSEQRAGKDQATPIWLTESHKKEIKNIYLVCIKINKATKKTHEVDHIIPLRGENVCGLHVPWNLRIIPKSLNRSKNNAYPNWGDSYLSP